MDGKPSLMVIDTALDAGDLTLLTVARHSVKCWWSRTTSFWGAYRTIQGYEAVHAIRKGQVRWVGVGQIVRQLHFIAGLFQIAI